MDIQADLLQRTARSEQTAAKIAAIRKGAAPVTFEHVTDAAHAFLAATVATAVSRSFWIVCKGVREQEALYNELVNWLPGALFLPELEMAAIEGAVPDPEISAERLALLDRLATSKERRVLVLTRGSLGDQVPAPDSLRKLEVKLRRSARLDRERLIEQLVEAGYQNVPQVSNRGQFAVRGGILDIFSWQHAMPVRVELFGDEIESLREFDLDNQTSIQRVDDCTLLLGEIERKTCALGDYRRKDELRIDLTGDLDDAEVQIRTEAEATVGLEDYSAAFFEHDLGEFDAGDFVTGSAKRERLLRQLAEWRRDDWRVVMFFNNEGEKERFRELLGEDAAAQLTFADGSVNRGFTFPAARIAVLSDAELFGRYRSPRAQRLAAAQARRAARRSQIDFSELNEGDYVVHLEHGIGRFDELRAIPSSDGAPQEVLVLEFANEARLFVPLEQAYLVSRYVGVGRHAPDLGTLGDGRWARAKRAAEGAVFDYAAKLLAVQAARETSKGHAFAPDNKWQREFEASFLYKETPDQLTAIADSKRDMEQEKPMERLICGDVGFGKTEVAIRAAFKSVMDGKQVAVLVPTTVLAQQHFNTFRERMADYPVTVEMLSRFRSQAEQRQVVAGLGDGSVDIVIGTHRLVSKDVHFKDLGLVVVDEEHRFGVKHKERFKEMFKLTDVLTLSATPIPRTLYLSLMGARDMSLIETPPPNRYPVETVICGYDERIIRDAIQRERSRQGQVYFLHNRIGTIERVAERIGKLCPGARVAIGHGQMDEDELETIMRQFVAGEIDVLVSTTIIESGLDIPNANTIIIDRADRFGLADLYQLRGRVGRAQHKAYAFLLLPRDMMTVGAARKRINAIKQYSTLGAGFKVAMRDLEIRGAGNVLGTAQSGHIIAVGFDLYCQLLKQAVASMKGEKLRTRVEVYVRIDFLATNEAEYFKNSGLLPAFIPAGYIEQSQTRIQAYRSLAQATTREQLDALRKDWRDRFGVLPEAVEHLLEFSGIKLAADAQKVTRVEVRDGKVMLTRGGDYVLIGGRFPRLTAQGAPLKLREISTLIHAL